MSAPLPRRRRDRARAAARGRRRRARGGAARRARPDADPPRTSVAAAAGELLLMPSAAGGGLGVKLVTIGGERPRIKGVFVLFDGETLAPAALLDGIGLTDVRTTAVSALAVRHLAARTPRGWLSSAPGRRRGRTSRRCARSPDRARRARRPRPRPHRGARRELGAEPARRTPSPGPTSSAAAPPRASRCSTATRWPRRRSWSRSAPTSRRRARSTSGSRPAPRSSSSRARARCARPAT